MARTAKIEGGAMGSFYLGIRHRAALRAFGRRHTIRGGRSEVLRQILDVVAETEGIETTDDALGHLEGAA